MASQVAQSIWKRISGPSFTTPLTSPTDAEDTEQTSPKMERSDSKMKVRFNEEDKFAAPGEYQIKRSGIGDTIEVVPGPDELPALWVRQEKDLNIACAEKAQLEEEIASLEFHKEALRVQVSDERRAKNFLEPRVVKLEKELGECYKQIEVLQLANEVLKTKVHEYADGIGSGIEEQEELKDINAQLLEQIKSTEEIIKAKEKTIAKLNAELRLAYENGVRCQVLEAENSALENELTITQKRLEEAMEQQQDTETENAEPFDEEMDGPGYSSLSDEMEGSDYDDDNDSGGEEDTTVDAVEGPSSTTPKKRKRYSTLIRRGTDAGTQTKCIPETLLVSESTQTHAEDGPTPESIEKNGKVEYKTVNTQTQAGDGPNPLIVEKHENSEYKTTSTQTPSTPSKDKESSQLDRYLAEQVPDAWGEKTYPSPSSKHVPAPLLEYSGIPLPGGTHMKLESSPLSLEKRSDSFSGKTGAGQLSPLSSIPESETASIGSPLPQFAENTPEFAVARLAKIPGSPESVTGSAMSGSTVFDSDPSSLLQSAKLFDLKNRDKRPGWQYQLYPRPSPSTRDGLSTKMAAILSQRTSRGVQTEGESVIQQTKRPGRIKFGKQDPSGQYSSLVWWMTLGALVLLWYLFGQEDKRLWRQANEATRQTTVALRDERWFGPAFLTRTDFLMENLVKIDRSLLG